MLDRIARICAWVMAAISMIAIAVSFGIDCGYAVKFANDCANVSMEIMANVFGDLAWLHFGKMLLDIIAFVAVGYALDVVEGAFHNDGEILVCDAFMIEGA